MLRCGPQQYSYILTMLASCVCVVSLCMCLETDLNKERLTKAVRIPSAATPLPHLHLRWVPSNPGLCAGSTVTSRHSTATLASKKKTRMWWQAASRPVTMPNELGEKYWVVVLAQRISIMTPMSACLVSMDRILKVSSSFILLEDTERQGQEHV